MWLLHICCIMLDGTGYITMDYPRKSQDLVLVLSIFDKAPTYDTSIPNGHQFKFWLYHFLSVSPWVFLHKQWRIAYVLGPLHIYEKSRRTSWLLALIWPNAGCCSRVMSEAANRFVPVCCLSAFEKCLVFITDFSFIWKPERSPSSIYWITPKFPK